MQNDFQTYIHSPNADARPWRLSLIDVDRIKGTKRPEHRTRIAAYRDALTALDHTKVQGLLVYMEDGEVIAS